MTDLDPELYRKIVNAHAAALDAHNYAYTVKTPMLVRMGLGKAQNILIRYVVRYAGKQ